MHARRMLAAEDKETDRAVVPVRDDVETASGSPQSRLARPFLYGSGHVPY
jgi:hypothetical protein